MQCAAAGRHEAITDACTEQQFIVSIEPDQYGIEAMRTRGVPTNHQLLRELDAHLRPCPSAPALFVGTGEPLGDYTLQPMASDQIKHLLGGNMEAFGKLNPFSLL